VSHKPFTAFHSEPLVMAALPREDQRGFLIRTHLMPLQIITSPWSHSKHIFLRLFFRPIPE
jgi:hypothetical protein